LRVQPSIRIAAADKTIDKAFVYTRLCNSGLIVKTGTETEDWRKKYLDSLRSLESEERAFKAMEATLKRLVGRLCVASLGLSPQLDEQLRKVQAAVRRDVTQDELEQLTPSLTEAIHALDDVPSASPIAASVVTSKLSNKVIADQASSSPPALNEAVANQAIVAAPLSSDCAIIDDQRVRSLLSAFVAEIKRDASLAAQVEALDNQLAESVTYAQLPAVLASLMDLVGQRIQRIEDAKQETEALLNQMVGKLDEIGQFVAEQSVNQNQALANSETLNTNLAGEMKAMGESVEAASDLQMTRLLVRTRIDSIEQHLQVFREREVERDRVIRARNEQMSTRMAELEAQAANLQNQLKDEQKLSSMDALTGVPNRLAYEKRMDEELKRWRRFGQPTCIAAWDIDYFKSINDNYGHRAGDRVLKVVAEALASRIRGTDFLARYGGEEFVMVLAGTRLDAAVGMIETIRTAIAKLGFHFRGKPVSITISCGVTLLTADDSSGTVFERADKALYQAKADGRNRCVSA
jgi:diguanylate cyclase